MLTAASISEADDTGETIPIVLEADQNLETANDKLNQYGVLIGDRLLSFQKIINVTRLEDPPEREPVDPSKFEYLCDICMYRCPSKTCFEEHHLRHSKNYAESTVALTETCDFCGKIFFDKESLRDHQRLNCEAALKAEKFECDFCQKIFSGKRSLKQHLNLHLKTKIYKCDMCNAIYYTNSALALHRRAHEEETCQVCHKVFKSHYIKEHMILHTGNYEIQCFICEKPVKNMATLKRHMKQHSKKSDEPNEITCECGRKFKNNQGYQIHKASSCTMTKQDSLKYKCTICGKSFNLERNLKRHIPSHSDKSYKWTCDKCQKKFNSQSNYKRHLYSHNTQKNIPCKYCKKLFKNFDSLRSHYIQHEGKMLKCSVCSKELPTATLLKYHLQKHHKDDKTL